MGTPLKKALNDAGLVSTADRLIAIEDDIVLHCGKNHEDAEFRLWIAIQHDADLMAEVFAPVRARTLANRIHDSLIVRTVRVGKTEHRLPEELLQALTSFRNVAPRHIDGHFREGRMV